MTKKSEFNFAGIYTITNKITGTVYVGQAVNIKNRWARHRRSYERNRKDNYLQRAWNKYGAENFIFSVYKKIDEADPHQLDILLDIEEIATLKLFQDNCYNLMEAGISGLVASKETLQKLSEHNTRQWQKPEHRAKISAAQKAAWNRPGRKAERTEQYKKAFERPEYKKRRKQLGEQMWAPGGHLRETQLERLKNQWKNPEYVAKQSESRKKSWQDPIIRECRSKAIRAAWAKRKGIAPQ